MSARRARALMRVKLRICENTNSCKDLLDICCTLHSVLGMEHKTAVPVHQQRIMPIVNSRARGQFNYLYPRIAYLRCPNNHDCFCY